MSDRILVVDDEESILNILCDILEKDGYTVYRATNARQALKVWDKNDKPGIVLTDLYLGADMDGVALCSRIRFEEPKTIVIAITGKTDQYQLAYCRGVGFNDVLAKPVEIDDLLDSVHCASQQRIRWEHIG